MITVSSQMAWARVTLSQGKDKSKKTTKIKSKLKARREIGAASKLGNSNPKHHLKKPLLAININNFRSQSSPTSPNKHTLQWQVFDAHVLWTTDLESSGDQNPAS